MLNLPQTPKWDIARVSHSTLINADCFDVFPFIEDKSIDAIICDLPYGTTKCKWDSILPLDKLWSDYKRVIKDNGIIILFGYQPFTSLLISSNISNYRYSWYWIKDKPSNFLMGKQQPLRYVEEINIFYQKTAIYNPQMEVRELKNKRTNNPNSSYTMLKHRGETEIQAGHQKRLESGNSNYIYPRNYQKFNNRTKGLHPTQKPIELLEYLIKTYTNEGDMVLDNTMGSGTTNLACIKLNRKSIGIEKEKQYYDVAVRRASELTTTNK